MGGSAARAGKGSGREGTFVGPFIYFLLFFLYFSSLKILSGCPKYAISCYIESFLEGVEGLKKVKSW